MTRCKCKSDAAIFVLSTCTWSIVNFSFQFARRHRCRVNRHLSTLEAHFSVAYAVSHYNMKWVWSLRCQVYVSLIIILAIINRLSYCSIRDPAYSVCARINLYHHHHHHLFYSGNMSHRKKNSTQTETAQKHTQKIQRNLTTIANI